MPATGVMTATAISTWPTSRCTSGSGVKTAATNCPPTATTRPKPHAADHTPADHPGGHGPAQGDLARPQQTPDDRLAGDGDGVQGEGEQHPDRVDHLVGGQYDGAARGGHHRGQRDGDLQGGGAGDQPDTGPGGGEHAPRVEPERYVGATGAPDHQITAITAAAAVWAIRVPMAEPRMPSPTP